MLHFARKARLPSNRGVPPPDHRSPVPHRPPVPDRSPDSSSWLPTKGVVTVTPYGDVPIKEQLVAERLAAARPLLPTRLELDDYAVVIAVRQPAGRVAAGEAGGRVQCAGAADLACSLDSLARLTTKATCGMSVASEWRQPVRAASRTGPTIAAGGLEWVLDGQVQTWRFTVGRRGGIGAVAAHRVHQHRPP